MYNKRIILQLFTEEQTCKGLSAGYISMCAAFMLIYIQALNKEKANILVNVPRRTV